LSTSTSTSTTTPAEADTEQRHPLSWVPTAYLAEGIPFALVIWVGGTLFKDLGHSDGEITLATASIGVVWSLKPLWAASLDMWKTKKFFVLATEYVMAALLGIAALCVQLPFYFQALIALFWLLAFASATQDICVDGTYITALSPKQQARYIAVQGVAWNLGRGLATAVLVGMAGVLQRDFGQSARSAWSYALTAGAASMLILALYHGLVLPVGKLAAPPESFRAAARSFVDALADFLRKPQLLGMLMFVFLYRSGEGFLLVEAPLFLQAPTHEGGASLSLVDKSWIDGTISTVVSVLAGLSGGAFVARYGLKRSLFWMALAMNIPHLCFVYLSHQVSAEHPLSFATVATWVMIEKIGYNFGFVANMLYMMQQIAPGKYPMTHYAFCTALMNLVLVPTQMASGPLAQWLGYKGFFVFVMVASVPSVIAAWLAPFPNAESDAPSRA
jgi:MFS transporter, PAT family, beta-lactamase induction signal transducer AmpG